MRLAREGKGKRIDGNRKKRLKDVMKVKMKTNEYV